MNAMLKSKLCRAALLTAVATVSSACSAAGSCQSEVFRCQASAPQALTLQLCQAETGFSLQQFSFAGHQQDKALALQNVIKDSYHRFKVDEHSLSFAYNGDTITLSDYYSAEFEPHEKTLSVTITHNGEKQFLTCDEGALSLLKSIENGSY